MDDVITLVKETKTGHDEVGNEILERTERELMCQIYSITRNEYYEAAVANLHPELKAILSDFADYEGEKTAIYDGTEYAIIRTYRDSGSLQAGRRGSLGVNGIELTLQRRVGDE